MGIMTLALSIFSIIPMVISFVNREFLAQVVTHLLKEMNNTESGMYVYLELISTYYDIHNMIF